MRPVHITMLRAQIRQQAALLCLAALREAEREASAQNHAKRQPKPALVSQTVAKQTVAKQTVAKQTVAKHAPQRSASISAKDLARMSMSFASESV